MKFPSIRFTLVLLVLVAALPAVAAAQDLVPVLRSLSAELGADDLTTLRYVGAGSSYTYEGEEQNRTVHRVIDWSHEVDLGRQASGVSVVRASGTPPVETDEAWVVDDAATWAERLDLWLVPQLFLQQALANEPRSEPRTVEGVDYTVVAFEDPEGNRIEGFIDPEGALARVRTEAPGEAPVVVSYLFYEEAGGVRFPGLIIRKRDGKLDLVLSVKEVEANPALTLAAG